MRNISIGSRLLSVAGLVRRGAVLADVGTDHAYLPIYLLKTGGIARAFCTDINEGPLRSAEENLKKEGLLGKAEIFLTSGCIGLEGKGITDYTICGMGGELIADIISVSEHLRNAELRLVLQPMTKAEQLRKFLWQEGFLIEKEVYSLEDGKSYVAMLAHFCGEPIACSPSDMWFGKELLMPELWSFEKRKYIASRQSVLKKIIAGKLAGGEENPPEEKILSEFYEGYGEI